MSMGWTQTDQDEDRELQDLLGIDPYELSDGEAAIVSELVQIIDGCITCIINQHGVSSLCDLVCRSKKHNWKDEGF